MFLYSLLSANAFDTFEPIAKWLTIGLLGCLLAVGVVLFFCKKQAFRPFVKYALLGAFLYLLALAVTLLSLDVAAHYSDDYAEENGLDKTALVRFIFVPLLCCVALTFLSVVAYLLWGNKNEKRKKTFGYVCFFVCVCALISALVCIAIYYNKKIANDGYYNSDTASVKQIALYLAALLAVAVIVGLAFTDKNKLVFDAKALAYAGICVSMSFALSYVKLWDMPQGGSITLVSLLPIMIYSYMFGAKKGVFTGFVYGVLQAVQDPWLIHPAQFLLDYPVAFSAAGLAGLFRRAQATEKMPQLRFAIGALVAGGMRFLCHTLSGVFAFEAYAAEQNAWVYSLVYNSYVFIDVALVIAAGVLVFSSKAFRATVQNVNK